MHLHYISFLIQHTKYEFIMGLVSCKSALLCSLVSALLIANTEAECWAQEDSSNNPDDMERRCYWITWDPARHIPSRCNSMFTELKSINYQGKKSRIPFWLQWATVTKHTVKKQVEFVQIIAGKSLMGFCDLSRVLWVRNPPLGAATEPPFSLLLSQTLVHP